jgi:hypothetical protein
MKKEKKRNSSRSKALRIPSSDLEEGGDSGDLALLAKKDMHLLFSSSFFLNLHLSFCKHEKLCKRTWLSINSRDLVNVLPVSWGDFFFI